MWAALLRVAAPMLERGAASAATQGESRMLSQAQKVASNSPKQPRQSFHTGSYGPTEPQITAHMSAPGSKY